MNVQAYRRSSVVVGTLVIGVAINVLIHTVGAASGATYEFTTAGAPAKVDTLTVAGCTALPLLVGLAAAATPRRPLGTCDPAAIIIGPAVALGSIAVMLVPADLVRSSQIPLALCHTMLVPVTIAGPLLIRRLGRPYFKAGGTSEQ